MRDRVVREIADRFVQQPSHSLDQCRGDLRAEVDAGAIGGSHAVRDDVFDDEGQAHLDEVPAQVRRLVGARKREQLLCGVREATSRVENEREALLFRRVGFILAHQFELRLDAGERSAQLMRGALQKPSLRRGAFAHRVEKTVQRLDDAADFERHAVER